MDKIKNDAITSFRTTAENSKRLKTLANANNMSVSKYVNNLVTTEYRKYFGRIAEKEATAHALISIGLDEDFAQRVYRIDNLENVMDEEKYKQAYDIFNEKYLELIKKGEL